MIGKLDGDIEFCFESTVLIHNNGIGYVVNIGSNVKQILQSKKEKRVQLYIYTVVKETELALFGFQYFIQRSLFEMLISVSGVGPKVALKIIDEIEANVLINTIKEKKEDILEKISGIGKKTAQRIILELEKKVVKQYKEFLLPTEENIETIDTVKNVKSALLNLGFIEKQVENVVRQNYTADKNFEDIFRECLHSLNQ